MAPPERFTREMACTEAEWLRWLPAAIGEHSWVLHSGAADISLGTGRLSLRWQEGPARRIALLHLPTLLVAFGFESVDEAERARFMKRFDLYTHRGGG